MMAEDGPHNPGMELNLSWLEQVPLDGFGDLGSGDGDGDVDGNVYAGEGEPSSSEKEG